MEPVGPFRCGYMKCSHLCSLFILSNETVNIWSHLLGFLLFFCLGVYNMASVLPAVGASREDYVIYSIALFCFQVLASGGFVCASHSHWWNFSQIKEPSVIRFPVKGVYAGEAVECQKHASRFQPQPGFFLFGCCRRPQWLLLQTESQISQILADRV